MAAAAFFCLILLFPRAAFSAEETLEYLQFASRWPDASPGNLETAEGTLFFAAGDVLVLLDPETFTEQSRIHLDAPRGIKDVSADPAGDVIYAACGRNGLKVVDVSDQTNPQIISTLSLDTDNKPIQATAADCLGSYLYLADNSFGLRIIDISKPENPGWAGEYEQISQYTNQDDEQETTSGGYINICAREVGSGRLAFVLDQYMGLRIFDVSGASSVQELDVYDMRSSKYFGQLSEVVDVKADNNYVYVSDAAYGIAILDYISPANKVSIEKEGQIKTPGSASGIALSADGDTLFLADGNSGLLVADMESPASARYDQKEDPQYDQDLVNAECYAVTGAYAVIENKGDLFLANAENGLAKLQKSGQLSYEPAETFDPPADACALSVRDDYGYVLDDAGAEEGLRIIELGNEETGRSRLAAFVSTPGNASAAAVYQSHAWVADGTEGVFCVDISDPKAPAVTDTFTYPGDARDIKILPDEEDTVYALIADRDQGLVIAEAGSRGGLSYTSEVFVENARAAALYENYTADRELAARYALLVNGQGLTVVDIADPANPVKEGFLDTSGDGGEALDVAAKPPYAVVANGSGGVLLADVSDPDKPKKIDSFEAEGEAQALSLHQSYIHTAAGKRGLLMLGITDTEPAKLVAIDIEPDEDRESPYYNTPGYSADAAVAGDDDERYTYIADKHGGFLAFLHEDTLGGGIDEQPFEESSDDSRCFIQILGR
ncbi:MAG: hypothetical protein R6X08_10115 [Desulfosalsimonadaceae bacterium]